MLFWECDLMDTFAVMVGLSTIEIKHLSNVGFKDTRVGIGLSQMDKQKAQRLFTMISSVTMAFVPRTYLLVPNMASF